MPYVLLHEVEGMLYDAPGLRHETRPHRVPQNRMRHRNLRQGVRDLLQKGLDFCVETYKVRVLQPQQ
jgi:hypothetical protein